MEVLDGVVETKDHTIAWIAYQSKRKRPRVRIDTVGRRSRRVRFTYGNKKEKGQDIYEFISKHVRAHLHLL